MLDGEEECETIFSTAWLLSAAGLEPFLLDLPGAKGTRLLRFEFEDNGKLLLHLEEPGLLERKKENMEEKRVLAKRADWKRGDSGGEAGADYAHVELGGTIMVKISVIAGAEEKKG